MQKWNFYAWIEIASFDATFFSTFVFWTAHIWKIFTCTTKCSIICFISVTQTPPNRQTDRPSLSSASSSARSSTTTTFPVHLDRPTSTNQQYQQGYRGHSFGLQPQQHHNPFTSHSSSSHSSQRRRPQSPTRAYLNPLFLGSNPSSTTWYNGSKKHQNGWYAKMLEFVRRCWRSRPTHRTSDEEPSSSSRGHKRTQSEVPGKERTLRANAREYNETLGYAVSS